jgi:hypothetical protein
MMSRGSGRNHAFGTGTASVEQRPAGGVSEAQAVAPVVAAAPHHQRVDHRPQVTPRRGQLVEVPAAVRGVDPARHHALVDQPRQTVGEHRTGLADGHSLAGMTAAYYALTYIGFAAPICCHCRRG